MTLLISTIAAAITTIIWYKKDADKNMMLEVPMYLFWGASLMWFVDAIFEYMELGAEYFTPELADMINDTFLGLSVVALGLVIWAVALMIKDPKHVLRNKLLGKSNI